MTKIEWVRGNDGSEGMSWNALRAVRVDATGKRRSANHCEHVNEACRNCYAEALNKRLGGLPFKPGHRNDYTFEIDEKKLLEPLRRRKPTRIFVESMSDAFGEWWPDEFIDKLYAVMALCPRHTFINLSKRPERRQKYLTATPDNDDGWSPGSGPMYRVSDLVKGEIGTKLIDGGFHLLEQQWVLVDDGIDGSIWPLANVIEGVSVSCQEEADAFIPILLDTPAALRCVSAEPLLGPIDFTKIDGSFLDSEARGINLDALRGGRLSETPWHLNWVIVGGESGPNGRPMHPDWARSIRDQCRAAGIAFFFKQWGEHCPQGVPVESAHGEPHNVAWPDGTIGDGSRWNNGGPGVTLVRVGKKRAGRLLDGIEHNGFPDVR